MYPANPFAILLFTIWPLIIFWFFKKTTVKKAIFLSIAVATLLLPVEYVVDYPLLPPLNKNTLTALTVFILLFIKHKKNPIFKAGTWNFILIAYLLTIVTSTLLNQDPVESGLVALPPSTPYDVISNIILFMLSFMPFILGRNFFNDPDKDLEYMFKALTTMALVYSFPMVYEIIMSPQLHIMIYGYFPGNFQQQMRDGGFRPVVFIGHGLPLSFWFTTAIITAIALFKTKVKVFKYFGWKMILGFIVLLVLCKTVSALIYTSLAVVLMFMFKPKKQMLLSLIITMMVMVYPLNATSQAVKYSDVLNFVSQYSKERAQSLETRFENEERLIVRALERPFFGWSGWGRGRVYSNGQDITITDGLWVSIIGGYGIIGFILSYSLLLYPIFKALKSYQYIEDDKNGIYFAALTLITALGVLDSIPNTGMSPVHILMAGALLGQSEFLKRRYILQRQERLNAINKVG